MKEFEDLVKRLEDKIELAVYRAMEKHAREQHEPMRKEVDAINRKLWTAGGLFTAIWGSFTLWLKN